MKLHDYIRAICLGLFIALWIGGIGTAYLFWGYMSVVWIKYWIGWAVLTGLSWWGANRPDRKN